MDMGSVVNASISTVSVILYFCFFVMGFGPIPNILCAEIFPTRVLGLCIAICALTFWIGDIIVTYTLPVMLKSIGLAGVFGLYAIVCLISWVFVFVKVPETKGMPLEVITEFFSVGAKQTADTKNNYLGCHDVLKILTSVCLSAFIWVSFFFIIYFLGYGKLDFCRIKKKVIIFFL